jgi:hypothetical protein
MRVTCPAHPIPLDFIAIFRFLYRSKDSKSETQRNISEHAAFLRGGVISPLPNTQTGKPPLVGRTLLFIQYIHNYPVRL